MKRLLPAVILECVEINMLTPGAVKEDWITFSILLGLTIDMLPVVSNPGALISPNSTMKDKGKVPSRYNTRGLVVGFPKWTAHNTVSAEVEQWMENPDYGICLQTRDVRAFDIDIPDPAYAALIRDFILAHLDRPLPERFRSNSGKCLLAFRMVGQFSKRTIKLPPHGIIEFLGNGQQFVACGQHPSGVHYEWRGGLPDYVPVLEHEKFEEIWLALKQQFGNGEEEKLRGARKNLPDVLVNDPVVEHLDILDYGNQGQYFIECPFKDGHTMDSGETECCYFPAGTKGYEQGHFVCMHAHCQERDDGEFLDALGIRQLEFEDLNAKPDVAMQSLRPGFKRAKDNAVLPTIDNISLACASPITCGFDIGYDNFIEDTVVRTWASADAWRPLVDDDYTIIQRHLEIKIGFRPMALDNLRRGVENAARQHQFDSAISWLNTLEWDGINRIDTFLPRYMQAEDSAYTRAVGRYIWTALAGRVLRPGIKADMVPIFVGEQGIFKSSAVLAFAPYADWFCNISLSDPDDMLIRKMRGKCVAEIGELRGLHTKELEAIKEFTAKTFDELIPKYKERRVKYPRRLIFFGTTNSREFLADETGNRRWLPIDVKTVAMEALIADRSQLWAEGRQLFRESGIAYSVAEQLAKEVHERYMFADPWENIITRWLETADEMDGSTPASRPFIAADELLQSALNFDARTMRSVGGEGRRLGAIMRKLGYERARLPVKGRKVYVWQRIGGSFC